MKVFGGIETGGTKITCMIASDPTRIYAETVFPTTTPGETIDQMIAFFQNQMGTYPINSLGIGTFGPVDLNKDSQSYGYITTTPKPGWHNTNLVGRIEESLKIPMIVDTDVNTAVLGEYLWGAGRGMDPLLYFTIGTGIGMGVRANNCLGHGLTHPEAGHIIVRRDPELDSFKGCCPYHGDCFEGLASGVALHKRWGINGENLPSNHPAWKLEANYIAQALCSAILIYSPYCIILGGGMMKQEPLFPMIRKEVLSLLNGYVQTPAIIDHIDQFIIPSGLGDRAGVLGCIALAMQAV